MDLSTLRLKVAELANELARGEDDAAEALVSNSVGQFLWAAFEHREISRYLQQEWREDVVRVAQRMFDDDRAAIAAPFDVLKDLLGELRALRDEEAARCAERERATLPASEGLEQCELFSDEEAVNV